ncbi:MAG: hypothetical protein OEO19_13280 [Gammaproteobacteria bacterium]|nr:hypothetical protein [Gammaproteobacteria bacterium]MDH3449366.1 hypothetical protein [Gammaproteobacteria bacterium]
MSSLFSRKPERLALLLNLLSLHALPVAAAACGAGVSAGDFPGTMIIEVDRTEIGIGSVAPFEGGSGHIITRAGPLVDGVATIDVAPDAFRIEPFLFPYIFSWETRLTAIEAGRGLIEIPISEGTGRISLDILLRAENRLGDVWLETRFTTGKSAPVRIADRTYDTTGEELELESGKAVLIATGKTSPESHIWFRRDDFYARTEVCIYFEKSD